jgi:hypothetical protein
MFMRGSSVSRKPRAGVKTGEADGEQHLRDRQAEMGAQFPGAAEILRRKIVVLQGNSHVGIRLADRHRRAAGRSSIRRNP